MTRLKGENLIDEKSINYSSLVRNELFQSDYLTLANQLKFINLDKLLVENDAQTSDSNILSFFISENMYSITTQTVFLLINLLLLPIKTDIYNALTLHAIAHLYETDLALSESINAKKDASILTQSDGKFWSRMAYIIGTGKHAYSLDDIEHGILRGNICQMNKILAQFELRTQEPK